MSHRLLGIHAVVPVILTGTPSDLSIGYNKVKIPMRMQGLLFLFPRSRHIPIRRRKPLFT